MVKPAVWVEKAKQKGFTGFHHLSNVLRNILSQACSSSLARFDKVSGVEVDSREIIIICVFVNINAYCDLRCITIL